MGVVVVVGLFVLVVAVFLVVFVFVVVVDVFLLPALFALLSLLLMLSCLLCFSFSLALSLSLSISLVGVVAAARCGPSLPPSSASSRVAPHRFYLSVCISCLWLRGARSRHLDENRCPRWDGLGLWHVSR